MIMADHKNVLQMAEARRHRMKMALPPELEAVSQVMGLWLGEAAPAPSPLTNWQDTQFMVSVNLDWSWMTWRAINRADVIQPDFLNLLAHLDLQALNDEFIQRAYDALHPALFGTWVKGTPEHIDMGWYLPGVHPIRKVLPLIESDMADIFAAWAKQYGVKVIRRFGRSVTPQNPFVEIGLLLPGETLKAQINAYHAFCEAVGVELLHTDVETVFHTMPGNIRVPPILAINFLTSGISKVGLLIPEPDTTTVLMLGDWTNPTFDHDRLAEFEGALGIEQREAIECQQIASGFTVEVHYLVPDTET